jgi:hypothetical protein
LKAEIAAEKAAVANASGNADQPNPVTKSDPNGADDVNYSDNIKDYLQKTGIPRKGIFSKYFFTDVRKIINLNESKRLNESDNSKLISNFNSKIVKAGYSVVRVPKEAQEWTVFKTQVCDFLNLSLLTFDEANPTKPSAMILIDHNMHSPEENATLKFVRSALGGIMEHLGVSDLIRLAHLFVRTDGEPVANRSDSEEKMVVLPVEKWIEYGMGPFPLVKNWLDSKRAGKQLLNASKDQMVLITEKLLYASKLNNPKQQAEALEQVAAIGNRIQNPVWKNWATTFIEYTKSGMVNGKIAIESGVLKAMQSVKTVGPEALPALTEKLGGSLSRVAKIKNWLMKPVRMGSSMAINSVKNSAVAKGAVKVSEAGKALAFKKLSSILSIKAFTKFVPWVARVVGSVSLFWGTVIFSVMRTAWDASQGYTAKRFSAAWLPQDISKSEIIDRYNETEADAALENLPVLDLLGIPDAGSQSSCYVCKIDVDFANSMFGESIITNDLTTMAILSLEREYDTENPKYWETGSVKIDAPLKNLRIFIPVQKKTDWKWVEISDIPDIEFTIYEPAFTTVRIDPTPEEIETGFSHEKAKGIAAELKRGNVADNTF